MELLDRVDLNDRVIGVTTKDEAHALGYIHRVAAIYVFTSSGQLLVQHRKKDGYLDHSVGGHVRQGESYDDAAQREMKEELGISARLHGLGVLPSAETLRLRSANIVHSFGIYETKLNEEELSQIVPAKDEVEAILSMSIEEVVEDMKKNTSRYTSGFISTMNFYIREKKLNVPIFTP